MTSSPALSPEVGPSPSADGSCERCYDSEHSCWTCCDGRRIRVTSDLSSPNFGKSIPCPDCVGGVTIETGRDTVETFLRRSRIPVRYRECRIETWTPDNERPRLAATSYVVRWAPEKPILLFEGNRGNGKTHLACGIIWQVWERHGKVGQFWNVQALLERYKAAYDEDTATEKPEAIDRSLDATPLLVLDDYGAHQASQWADALLFKLVDYRYANGLPLVVTTNENVLSLPKRITSRLMDTEVSTIVSFQYPDRRLAG